MQKFVDVNNYVWVVTSNDIKVYNLQGVEQKIRSGVSFYDYNCLGTQVLCRTGYIDCADFDVEVTKDAVRVLTNDHNGVIKEYVRYDTSLFRKFYQTLLYATIVDAHVPEDEAALLAQGPMLTLTVTTKDVDGTLETNSYSFYQISSRKAYITINGKGGFYVYKNRIDKFITDAQRFFDYLPIEPTDKT